MILLPIALIVVLVGLLVLLYLSEGETGYALLWTGLLAINLLTLSLHLS